MRTAFLQESKNPVFKWKMGMHEYLIDRGEEDFSPEDFVSSTEFETNIREQYNERVQEYLLEKRWFKLVDCLEEASDWWNYGHDMVTVPFYNVYIPTKNTLINKPKMNDEANDETSYRYNLNRLSPYYYLNTLKGRVIMLTDYRLQNESKFWKD